MTETDIRSAKGSTIARVLDILSSVTAAEQPVTATELAEMLDIPKASAHRLCSTLEAVSYTHLTLPTKA